VAGASANNSWAMGSTVRWRSDFDKLVVTSNCERRGWQRWVPGEGEDWNFFWANVHTVKQIFNPDNGFRMGEHQMVLHPQTLKALRTAFPLERGKATRAALTASPSTRIVSRYTDMHPAQAALFISRLCISALCRRPRFQSSHSVAGVG
jgi:hypothetical protein